MEIKEAIDGSTWEAFRQAIRQASGQGVPSQGQVESEAREKLPEMIEFAQTNIKTGPTQADAQRAVDIMREELGISESIELRGKRLEEAEVSVNVLQLIQTALRAAWTEFSKIISAAPEIPVMGYQLTLAPKVVAICIAVVAYLAVRYTFHPILDMARDALSWAYRRWKLIPVQVHSVNWNGDKRLLEFISTVYLHRFKEKVSGRPAFHPKEPPLQITAGIPILFQGFVQPRWFKNHYMLIKVKAGNLQGELLLVEIDNVYKMENFDGDSIEKLAYPERFVEEGSGHGLKELVQDTNVQRECREIDREFRVTEGDGLEEGLLRQTWLVIRRFFSPLEQVLDAREHIRFFEGYYQHVPESYVEELSEGLMELTGGWNFVLEMSVPVLDYMKDERKKWEKYIMLSRETEERGGHYYTMGESVVSDFFDKVSSAVAQSRDAIIAKYNELVGSEEATDAAVEHLISELDLQESFPQVSNLTEEEEEKKFWMRLLKSFFGVGFGFVHLTIAVLIHLLTMGGFIYLFRHVAKGLVAYVLYTFAISKIPRLAAKHTGKVMGADVRPWYRKWLGLESEDTPGAKLVEYTMDDYDELWSWYVSSKDRGSIPQEMLQAAEEEIEEYQRIRDIEAKASLTGYESEMRTGTPEEQQYHLAHYDALLGQEKESGSAGVQYRERVSKLLDRLRSYWEYVTLATGTSKSHLSLLKNAANRSGRSLEEVERVWQHAMERAAGWGKPQDFGLVTTLFKQELGIKSLRESVEETSRADLVAAPIANVLTMKGVEVRLDREPGEEQETEEEFVDGEKLRERFHHLLANSSGSFLARVRELYERFQQRQDKNIELSIVLDNLESRYSVQESSLHSISRILRG